MTNERAAWTAAADALETARNASETLALAERAALIARSASVAAWTAEGMAWVTWLKGRAEERAASAVRARAAERAA